MIDGKDIERPYEYADVMALRGSLQIKYTLAETGCNKILETTCKGNKPVAALGALTGNQAVQQVRAGLEAVYVSGWQVAADANISSEVCIQIKVFIRLNSVPEVVKKINKALQRADQIDHSEDKHDIDWYVPIIADAEAGFGGPLNAYELMKGMIEAGACLCSL